VRRALVRALAGACRGFDAFTHRPLAPRLLPGLRRCRLAALSRREELVRQLAAARRATT